MKRVGLLRVFAAAVAGSCASGPAVQSQVANEASLHAANAEYDRAILAADAAALGRIYTEDFSFVGNKPELRNKQKQIRYMANGSLRVLTARSDDIAVTRLGIDRALLTGRFTGRFRAGTREEDFVER